MKGDPSLEAVIRGILEAKLEYDRRAFGKERPHELGTPASAKQIAKLERILGKSLPPSYRAFLELHNGWSDFDGGAKLLAVEDHGSNWVKERLVALTNALEENDDNPFEMGAIPVLLGEHEHNFTLLHPNTVRKNGEMDFVTYDYWEEEDRFKDFTSYLRDCLAVDRQAYACFRGVNTTRPKRKK